MSNEEHVEEMFYFAHISGVFTQFSEKVSEIRQNNPRKTICEVTEHVFDEFTNNGLINSDVYLFI
jgi:hypothetical protein